MDTTLVIGGTGKTGRRVAQRLAAQGAPVRIGSRKGTPPFDWEDEATWAPALDGVAAAYISYYPDIAIPGTPEKIGRLAEVALRRGVRRQVLLSGRGEEEAQRAEQALQAAGGEWTIVRCSWFNQNFNEGWLLEPVLSGTVALPVADMREPFVDADDIADVATAALTGEGHAGQVYELTGPRLLTFAEAVGEIARATGRDLRFVTVGIEDYTAALTRQGLGAEEVGLISYLFTEVLDGRNAHLTDGVQRALGRASRDFTDFARDAAAAGAWDAR